jgi:hypothetical protein
MKFLVSILLLLITTIYILPVKEAVNGGFSICMADMENEKEESDKKEKPKDFFPTPVSDLFLKMRCCNRPQHIAFNIPVPFHTIETPPPDNNG